MKVIKFWYWWKISVGDAKDADVFNEIFPLSPVNPPTSAQELLQF